MNKQQNNGLVTAIVIVAVLVGIGYFLFARTSKIEQPINLPYVAIPTSSCIDSQEAYNEYGKSTCVEYYVGFATTSKNGNVFLDEKTNYTSGFSVTIYSNNVSKFNDPVTQYSNKTIDVSGTIAQYQGHPEIIVSDPSQISIK